MFDIRHFVLGCNLLQCACRGGSFGSSSSPHRWCLFFDRAAGNRFDAPDRSYGVMYLGADAHCAFIETFGQATGDRFATQHALEQRLLSVVETKRILRLVDFAS
jgi:hypothetical protein